MSTITQPRLSRARAARIEAIEDLSPDTRMVLWALAEAADDLDATEKRVAIDLPDPKLLYINLTPRQMADRMVHREYRFRAQQAEVDFDRACRVAAEGEIRS
jgi:hypothetical protein